MNLRKNFIYLIIPLLFSSPVMLSAQEDVFRKLFLRLGTLDLHLLDEQASPILYQGNGIQAQFGFERQKNLNHWVYSLSLGQMTLLADDPEVRFGEEEAGTSVMALQLSYLRVIPGSNSLSWSYGARLQNELLLDFEAIGDFPWIFAQGGIFAQTQLEYRLGEKHQLSGGFALPVFSWIIDMPYSQVPRTEGKAPGVGSAIREGFRIPSWATYQRVDLSLGYQFNFAEKWSLESQYQWAWFHDKEPRNLWAYQGRLGLGISHRW
ncbi:MAG: hypothetical protein AAFR87_22280 [Bacteroidota bacterium]